jgi:hypothetical protein
MTKKNSKFDHCFVDGKFKYLSETHPEIAKCWHPSKNDKLDSPHKITCVSKVKVWWRCENKHVLEDSVYNRVFGRGCQMCSASGNDTVKKYRRFNEAYKLKIVKVIEKNRSLDKDHRKRIIEQEGLLSSQVSQWKRQLRDKL